MGMGSSPMGDNQYCQVPEVESGAAMLALWANLITGVLAALVSPLAGKISDALGRIKIMAGCSIGILAAALVVVLVASMPDTFGVKWLYFSFLLEGLRLVDPLVSDFGKPTEWLLTSTLSQWILYPTDGPCYVICR